MDDDEERANTAERVRRHRARMKERRHLIKVEMDEADLYKLYRHGFLKSSWGPIEPESFGLDLRYFGNDELAGAVEDAVKQLLQVIEKPASNDVSNNVARDVANDVGNDVTAKAKDTKNAARDAKARELHKAGLPYREIADALAEAGFVTRKGTPYNPSAIGPMLKL